MNSAHSYRADLITELEGAAERNESIQRTATAGLSRRAAEALRAGLNSEAKIRADEARQIMFALDRYPHASDYGPPIQKRIALHEGDATGGEAK